MDELWQLYDENGTPIPGKGAKKDEVFGKGLLHGAAHVWIWRRINGTTQVLLQKRAASKRTWPGLYDISAAGHIDLDEEPAAAAARETKEEIGLSIDESVLTPVTVHRTRLVADDGSIENEFQWIYLLQLPRGSTFSMREAEVESVLWQDIGTFKAGYAGGEYVPHGSAYYKTVAKAIEAAAAATV